MFTENTASLYSITAVILQSCWDENGENTERKSSEYEFPAQDEHQSRVTSPDLYINDKSRLKQ